MTLELAVEVTRVRVGEGYSAAGANSWTLCHGAIGVVTFYDGVEDVSRYTAQLELQCLDRTLRIRFPGRYTHVRIERRP